MMQLLIPDLNGYRFLLNISESLVKANLEFVIIYIEVTLTDQLENYTALDIHQIINN